MKRTLFALFMLVAVPLFADVSLSQAEEHYKNSEYQDALALYLKLYETAPKSPELLYNLGNVYYQMGELGEAITFYLRAERFMPRNADLNENLALASSRVVDDVQDAFFLSEFFATFIHKLTVNEWYFLWFLLCSILLFFVVLPRFRDLTDKQRVLRNTIAIVLIFVSGVLMWSVSDIINSEKAVIITRKIDAKSGPSESLKTKFFVHEGTRIHVIKTLNGWSEVKLKNGFRGWIPQTSYWTI
jgi:tetratricopeptide (TPR) repeat protein